MMSCRLYQSHFNQKIMHEYYGHHDMIYGKSSHHKSWVSFGNAAELAIVCIKNTELYLSFTIKHWREIYECNKKRMHKVPTCVCIQLLCIPVQVITGA